MEYISRESIQYEKIGYPVQLGCQTVTDYCLLATKESIDSIPAADVAEVIHCRDCRFFMDQWYCEKWNNLPGQPDVVGDMFCSLGERKTDLAEIVRERFKKEGSK